MYCGHWCLSPAKETGHDEGSEDTKHSCRPITSLTLHIVGNTDHAAGDESETIAQLACMGLQLRHCGPVGSGLIALIISEPLLTCFNHLPLGKIPDGYTRDKAEAIC